MKILIDECLPRKLKFELPNHDVQTVPEAGWAGKKNGELLRLMSDAEFEAFITVDSNMQYQQQLMDLPIGFIVLSAQNNKLETLQPLMPQVATALDKLQIGQIVTIQEEE